jgi:hypothetical protein
MRAKCSCAVSLQDVVAQVQALQRRERSEVGPKPGPAISLKVAVNQVKAPQRQERLEVRAKRGGIVSFDEVVSQFQALCRDESTARWGASAAVPSACK